MDTPRPAVARLLLEWLRPAIMAVLLVSSIGLLATFGDSPHYRTWFVVGISAAVAETVVTLLIPDLRRALLSQFKWRARFRDMRALWVVPSTAPHRLPRLLTVIGLGAYVAMWVVATTVLTFS